MREKKVEINGSTQGSTGAIFSLNGIENFHMCCICLNIKRMLSEPIKYMLIATFFLTWKNNVYLPSEVFSFFVKKLTFFMKIQWVAGYWTHLLNFKLKHEGLKKLSNASKSESH